MEQKREEEQDPNDPPGKNNETASPAGWWIVWLFVKHKPQKKTDISDISIHTNFILRTKRKKAGKKRMAARRSIVLYPWSFTRMGLPPTSVSRSCWMAKAASSAVLGRWPIRSHPCVCYPWVWLASPMLDKMWGQTAMLSQEIFAEVLVGDVAHASWFPIWRPHQVDVGNRPNTPENLLQLRFMHILRQVRTTDQQENELSQRSHTPSCISAPDQVDWRQCLWHTKSEKDMFFTWAASKTL